MFEGQVIFITGTTGFLGKVILEKLLRSFPDIKKVFILIRNRKDQSAAQRCAATVKASPIFQRLRRETPEFERLFDEIVHVVEGEISQPRLGMSDSDYAEVTASCDVILSSAASVDFVGRLDHLFETNVTGSQNILTLAKECSRNPVLVHVSTAYVNAFEAGIVQEQEVSLSFDPEALYHEVLQMPAAEIESATPQLLNGFPNSYTLSKAIAEKMLAKNKGDVPLVIVRPTIIGGALREPVKGWVDAATAAGSLFLACGMGAIWFMPGKATTIGDEIPVDHVCNLILAAAHTAVRQPPTFDIMHCGTSDLNPASWAEHSAAMCLYWKERPPKGQLRLRLHTSSPSAEFWQDDRALKRRFQVAYAPLAALGLMKYLPLPPNVKSSLKKLQRVPAQITTLFSHFGFFTLNTWIFKTRALVRVRESLSPEERELLPIDVEAINWRDYNIWFTHCLHKYVLKDPSAKPLDASFKENENRSEAVEASPSLKDQFRAVRKKMFGLNLVGGFKSRL